MNYFSNDDDYIDIEVSSCSYFSLCPNSSTQNKEIEFQMASITNYKKESTTSPANELFSKGRVQKILQTEVFEEEDYFSINFLITPIGSPSQSCMVSFEPNPKDHKISSKKLWYKMIKHSLIIQKFKASRAFLKSLFTKSSCTNYNCCCTNNMKVSKKKTPFKNTTRNNIGSLSSIKWQPKSSNGGSSSFSSTNSSSTFDSFSSSHSCSLYSNFLKKSNNFTSDIDAAIAHCKKSQHFTIPQMELDNSLLMN